MPGLDTQSPSQSWNAKERKIHRIIHRIKKKKIAEAKDKEKSDDLS